MQFTRKVKTVVLVAASATILSCDDPPFGKNFGSSSRFTGFRAQLGAESVSALALTSAALEDVCEAVAHDGSGNMYCGGSTLSDLAETNGGLTDAVVMKVDQKGIIKWVKQLGAASQVAGTANNTSGSETCTDITVDGAGNVYCSGQTNGALAEVNGGGTDVFYWKLNSGGTTQFLKQLGATTDGLTPIISSVTGNETGGGIAVDSAGNLFSAVSTTSSFVGPNGGGTDVLVMKLNSAGSVQWATQLGTASNGNGMIVSSAGNDSCSDIKVDSSGKIFCSGTTTGNLGENNGGGGGDALILKFDSTSGGLLGIVHLGSATAAILGTSAAGNDSCAGVGIDNSGNVYCAGSTTGNLGEANGGSSDIFALKVNSAGAVQWVSQLGATTSAASSIVGDSTAAEACLGIAVDSGGGVFCSGNANGPLGEASGTGLSDAVVVKWNSLGSVQWIRQFGSVTVTDPAYNRSIANDVSVSPGGYIFIGGFAYGDLAETNGGGGFADLFVARIKPDGSL